MSEGSQESYRVFISYAHTDKDYARKIRDVLKEIENEENENAEKSKLITPLCDTLIGAGRPFDAEIKWLISHSHVFLPIISEESSKRGWVHQEIGYAMALNIPVLPVAVKGFAGEMLQMLNVIKYSHNKKELKKRLSYSLFKGLVSDYKEPMYPLYECAMLPDDRALLFSQRAKQVARKGFYGMVRQKGGLSSFQIPREDPHSPDWNKRYANQRCISEFHREVLRRERIQLEKHARGASCRLIIDPQQEYSKYGIEARLARLSKLIEFIEDMPSDKIQIVFDSSMQKEESLTIVGSWFLAESVSSLRDQGYRQTIFTRHAPYIERRIKAFDYAFDYALRRCEWKAEDCGAEALRVLIDTRDKVQKEVDRIIRNNADSTVSEAEKMLNDPRSKIDEADKSKLWSEIENVQKDLKATDNEVIKKTTEQLKKEIDRIIRKNADSVISEAEKMPNDMGDRIDEADKSKLWSEIENVREALKTTDSECSSTAAIKKATEQLATTISQISTDSCAKTAQTGKKKNGDEASIRGSG